MSEAISDRKKRLERSVRLLFMCIIEDLKNGFDEEKSGWRARQQIDISQEDHAELSKLGLLQGNLMDEFRLDFKDGKVRKALKDWKLQFDQIDYFVKNRDMMLVDQQRISDCKAILEKNMEMLLKSLDILRVSAWVGLMRMLNVSEVPALLDRVLEQGFSPREWAVTSVRSARNLAVEMACKIGEDRAQRVEDLEQFESLARSVHGAGFLDRIPYSKSSLTEERLQQVRNVLDWNRIRECLSEKSILFLGASWFLFYALEVDGVFPLGAESSTKLSGMVEDVLKKLLKLGSQESLASLLSSLNTLENEGVTWAPYIIFPPRWCE